MSDANELSAIAAAVETAARSAYSASGCVIENDEEGVCCIVDSRAVDSAGSAVLASSRARERVEQLAAVRARHERVVRMALDAVTVAEEAAALAKRIAELEDFECTDPDEDEHAERVLELKKLARQKAGIARRAAARLVAQAKEIEASAWRQQSQSWSR